MELIYTYFDNIGIDKLDLLMDLVTVTGKIYVFHGPGGSGKSGFLTTITYLYGGMGIAPKSKHIDLGAKSDCLKLCEVETGKQLYEIFNQLSTIEFKGNYIFIINDSVLMRYRVNNTKIEEPKINVNWIKFERLKNIHEYIEYDIEKDIKIFRENWMTLINK